MEMARHHQLYAFFHLIFDWGKVPFLESLGSNFGARTVRVERNLLRGLVHLVRIVLEGDFHDLVVLRRRLCHLRAHPHQHWHSRWNGLRNFWHGVALRFQRQFYRCLFVLIHFLDGASERHARALEDGRSARLLIIVLQHHLRLPHRRHFQVLTALIVATDGLAHACLRLVHCQVVLLDEQASQKLMDLQVVLANG